VTKLEQAALYLRHRIAQPTTPPKWSNVTTRRAEFPEDVDQRIKSMIPDVEHYGVLLSGGRDSGLIMGCLPCGTLGVTVRFEDGDDETSLANERFVGTHIVVPCSRDDMICDVDPHLFHPLEIPVRLACQAARASGITHLFCGQGADTNFSFTPVRVTRPWIEANDILDTPTEDPIPFVDDADYSRNVRGLGTKDAFDRAAQWAGVKLIYPFHGMRGPSGLLDLAFEVLAGGKVERRAFHAPLHRYLPRKLHIESEHVRKDIDWSMLNGQRRWYVRCVDRWLRED
jgi:asparagine synthetase B (glutamine-hydrolysing)